MLAASATSADVVRPALPIHLTAIQRDALLALSSEGLDPAVNREAHKTLRPILAPIDEAVHGLRLVARTRSAIRKVILQGMRKSGKAYGRLERPHVGSRRPNGRRASDEHDGDRLLAGRIHE